MALKESWLADAKARRDADVLEVYGLLLEGRHDLTGAAIKRAMGTKDHRTYADIVARHSGEVAPDSPADTHGPQFEHDAWEGRLKVKWWEDAAGTIHEEGATLTATPVEGGWFGLPFVVITPGGLNAFEQYLRDDFESVTGEDWADDRARANPDNDSEVARLHRDVAEWWRDQGK